MKRRRIILIVGILFVIPLAVQAALLGTLAIGGYAYNGSEQTNEANTISDALSAYGVNGGGNGGSSYRNSYYRFSATGGYYFTLNGANLGSNITIVHKKDWIGVATNLCASWGSGWNDGQNVNDSNCNYYATWGRSDRTLGLNSPSAPSAPGWISGSCPSPGTTATISWGSVSGSGITYALRADKSPSSWNGSCNPSSGSGDYCQDGLTSTSRSISTTPGATYQTWVHAVNSGGWSGQINAFFTCAASCPSGYIGVYPNCTPAIAQACSYDGLVQWDDCYKYYSGTVQSGSSVILQNSNSAYTGSATFSCSNGTWNKINTSCSTVVNGRCLATHYDCSSGGSTNNQSNATTWTWSCTGRNGGSTASCSEPKTVNGSCSSSHYDCNVGNSTNHQSNSTNWTWSCTGLNNGNTVSCSETKPIDGSCASAHYNCSAGSSTNNQSNSTNWTWSCNGTAGGEDASCSESKPVTTYTITASAGTGGSISPSGTVSVTLGNNQSFTITPSGGYNIASVIVDGSDVGAVSSRTFSNVQGNHTISALFTVANTAPNTPLISGPTSGNASTLYTFSVNSTDLQGDQVRYGIDWTEPSDGVADVWLPAGVGYVNSGTTQSTAHSWSTSGVHTFKALAQDAPGLNSGWANYSFTVAACTPAYFCSGSDLYYRNASCVESLSQSCSYGCSGSACIPPPSIAFVPFSATNVLYGPFTATGHLEVRPSLLWSGDTTSVYWNVSNAQSCTVTGSNGDSWSGAFSGASGRTSSPIVSQTTYTLSCSGLSGAAPPSITETVNVNIIPVFEEK